MNPRRFIAEAPLSPIHLVSDRIRPAYPGT